MTKAKQSTLIERVRKVHHLKIRLRLGDDVPPAELRVGYAHAAEVIEEMLARLRDIRDAATVTENLWGGEA